MTPPLLVLLAAVTAVAAAAGSTWSPCGLSMLSSITPLAERGRGRRFAGTASWFVLGAALGGATLGSVAALLAAVVRAAGLGVTAVGSLVVVAAALAAIIDRGVPGALALPHHRRQVNELWLNRYRGWVCGVGFGWQIGTGVGTYIMTSAVYLVVLLGALSAEPLAALALCTLFGSVRGLAILLVAGVRTPSRLTSFHRRFDAARQPVRLMVIAVEVAVVVTGAAVTGGVPAGLAAVAVAAVVAVVGRVATERPARDDRPPLTPAAR
jgi:MFS family permease